MTDRGGHSKLKRTLLKRARARGSSNTSAAAGRGMSGDHVRTLRRTTGIQAFDRGGHLGLQLEILACTTLSVALTPTGPCRLIGKALGFGLLERGLLNQYPLAFIAATRPAEPHNHRGQAATASRTPSQRSVT